MKDMPKQFTNWMMDNNYRIQNAKSLPYFIRDNKGINFEIKPRSWFDTEDFAKTINKRTNNQLSQDLGKTMFVKYSEEASDIRHELEFQKYTKADSRERAIAYLTNFHKRRAKETAINGYRQIDAFDNDLFTKKKQ